MKESTIAIILISIFFILGFVVLYFSITSSSFNFYKSEISVNGSISTEKLFFKPDKPYHTLYRNFVSPATTSVTNQKNSIQVNNVLCQSGQAYFRSLYSSCTFFSDKKRENQQCYSYTENNEYGCTFGVSFGFEKAKEYFIESTYELKPENLFQINGKNYIKFIAYSENRHVLLKESNFKVSQGIIKENSYYPQEQVILYIPFQGNQRV